MTSKDHTVNFLDNFVLKETLNEGRNPVYLVSDVISNRQVILKTFPYEKKPEAFYMREKTLFQFLKHKHIVSLHQAVDTAVLYHPKCNSLISSAKEYKSGKISYLVLEYAIFGSFNDIIMTKGALPEVLARTVFRQLVDAVSFMHGKYIAHMDLKCSNMVIDENYDLKVIDFDLSQSLDTLMITSGGTLGYRCPELVKKRAQDLKPIDIYSMGVILFILVSGHPPYTEYHANGVHSNYDAYYRLLRGNASKFWETHSRSKGEDHYSEEFKKLFMSMVDEKPENRANLHEVRSSEWFNQEVLAEEGYKIEMSKYLKGSS